MGRRKFRINVMGYTHTWWCVEEKKWWGWKTIAPRLNSVDDARFVISVLEERA